MPTAVISTHVDFLNAMMYANAKVNQLKCAILNASDSILKDQLKWICNNSECVKELEENCQKAMHGIVPPSSTLTNIPFTSPSFVAYEKGKTLCEESITSGVLGDATCYLETPERNPSTLVQHRCRTYPQEFLPFPCIRYSKKWSDMCGEITSQHMCSTTAVGGRCVWDAPMYIAAPSASKALIPQPGKTVAPSGAPTPWKLVPQSGCQTPTALLALLPGTDTIQMYKTTAGDFCRLKNYVQDATKFLPPTALSQTAVDYKIPLLKKSGIDKGLIDSFLPCTMGGCEIQGENLCNNLNVENVVHFRVAPNDTQDVNTYFKKDNPYWVDWGNTSLADVTDKLGASGWMSWGTDQGSTADWRTSNQLMKPTPGNFQFNPSGETLTKSDIWLKTFSPANPEYEGCTNGLRCGQYLTPTQDLIKHTVNFDMFIPSSDISDELRYYGDGTYKSAAYDPKADKNFLFSCNPVAPSLCLPGANCMPGSPLPSQYMPPATKSPSPRLITPSECAANPGYIIGLDPSSGKRGCVKSGECALQTQFPVNWTTKNGENACRYHNYLGKKWCIYPRTRSNTQPNPADGKIASCVPPFKWNEQTADCGITQPYCDYYQREYCPDGEHCTFIGRQGSPFTMGVGKSSVKGPDCYVNGHDSWEGVVTGVPAMILDQTRWGNQEHSDDNYVKGSPGAAADGTADIVYPDIWKKSTWSNTCSLPQWVYVEKSNTCQICPPNWADDAASPSLSNTPSSPLYQSCNIQNKDNRISIRECQEKMNAANIKKFAESHSTKTPTAPTPATKESFTYSFKNKLREAFTRKERFVDKQIESKLCAEPLIEHFKYLEQEDDYKKYRENANPTDELRTKLIDMINTHGMDIVKNLQNRHYILVDEREVYDGMKIQTHAYGEDLHMYSVKWEKDGTLQFTPLARDIEKVCPKCIVNKNYKGNKRKYLKLTPNILKKYPRLHKLYATTIQL